MTNLGGAADVQAGRAREEERSRMAASLRYHLSRLLLAAICGVCLSPTGLDSETTEGNDTAVNYSVGNRLPLLFRTSPHLQIGRVVALSNQIVTDLHNLSWMLHHWGPRPVWMVQNYNTKIKLSDIRLARWRFRIRKWNEFKEKKNTLCFWLSNFVIV